MPQARLKILSAAAENQCSRINKYLRKKKGKSSPRVWSEYSQSGNTLHRQRVGHLRREAPKYRVVHFYRVGNFIG